jgi:hypothetical protein
MSFRFAATGLLLAATALAQPAASKSRADGAAAQRDALRAEARLHDAVERHVNDAGLKRSLQGYRLDSNVVQLRRYAEGRKRKLVCVVDLALSDPQGSLLASVRGNATTLGTSEDEALDAAAYSAVSRLPQVLKAAKSQ